MPVLPPLQTLQAADQINQFQEPDRMNVGPRPVAPAPMPGTGQVSTLGGFSADYTSKVLNAGQSNNPAQLNEYSGENVYNPRYRSILPGEDSEEAFAKAQPWYKKWANATLKMGATAVGTFWNGITAIPDTIAGLKSGTNPYETKAGTGIDKWLSNLENEFPNYYTKWEQEHPWLSAVPFSGGGANFWSNKFLQNLGFTVGAIGGAAVQDLAIGAVTEGFGEIPLIGNQIGKASLYLNKLFTGSDRVGELLALGKQAGRSEQQLVTLKNLVQSAAATKINNGARFAMNLYGAAASEAGFEARDGYNTVKKDLTDDFIKQHGYAPQDKEVDDIEKAATASGNVRFGINLALLGLSDAIQFDAFLKPFSAAKAGYRGTLQRELEEGAGHIGLKKDSIDEFERVKAPTIAGRMWDRVHPYIPAILSEGVYEEGGQYGAQVGTQNYYERKYLYDKGMDKTLAPSGRKQFQPTGDDTEWDSRDTINNILHSVGNGLGGEFGTTEGWENILLGGLTAIFSSGLEHFMDRKENAEHRKNVLDLLNKQGVTGTLQNTYDTAVTANRISQDMKQAVKSGDLFKYKNYQHEQFVNFVVSGLKAGRFDLRIAQMDLLKDMSDDEFKKAFGLDKTQESVSTVTEYVDKLKEEAKEIKGTYELIDKTFNNPYERNSKAKTKEEVLENEKHHEFNDWKDQLTYLSTLIPDANKRKRSIATNIKKIDGYINPSFVQELTNRKGVEDYSKLLKEQIKTLEGGIKDKATLNRAEDIKKLNLLKSKVDLMDKVLANPTSQGEANLFEELLNFQLNGETASTEIQAPKSGIAELMKMGVDLNRLDVLKKSANKAFEVLSSKEGFEKYFKDVAAAKAAKAAQIAQQATPPAQQPSVAPPPTPKPTINIKNKEGKEKVFEEGSEHFLPTEPGAEPEKVTILRKGAPDGLVVQKENGDQVIIPTEALWEGDVLGTQIDEAFDATTEVTDTPPPTEGQPSTKRGESKKDMAWGMTATTDPPYDVKTTPDDNFQRRHQNFLFNMGSQDSEVFNQENKPKLRIVPVTTFTQQALGFPKDWIEDKGTDPDSASIRAVYVIDDRVSVADQERDKKAIQKDVLATKSASEGGVGDVMKNMFRSNPEAAIDALYDQYKAGGATREEFERTIPEDIRTQIIAYKEDAGVFYADGKGERMGSIGSEVDPSKAIYTNFASTDLNFGEGNEERYTNKENLDPDKVKEWWKERRKALLGATNLQQVDMYQFEVSRGIPNEVDPGTRNSIVQAGLIRYEDLDKPVMEVLTLGNVAITGALNNDGEGIAAHKTSVNMGDMGKQVFNFGGNMGYLDPRKLTHGEASDVYELIHYIADRNAPDKTAIFNYLHRIIYMPNLKPDKSGKVTQKPTASSVVIQGSNLYLGLSKTPILMNRVNLENHMREIVEFLEGTFHNVRNSEILRIAKNPKANDLAFNELRIRDGKVDIRDTWANYNHYLLSDKYPDGRQRNGQLIPLTTKIVRPQQGEVPIIQKYSVLKGMQMDSKLMQATLKQTTTPTTVKDKLKSLGWSDAAIERMSPKMVGAVMSENITPEQFKASIQKANEEQGVQEAPTVKPPENLFEALGGAEGLNEADDRVKARQEEKVIDTIQLGPVKLAFQNIVRDPQGNITDLEVVGRMNEDGTITPVKDPVALRGVVLTKIKESQIKQDLKDRLGSLKDRLADKNRKKGPDAQYRLAGIVEPGSYTKGDVDAEMEEVHAMIPSVPVVKLDNLIRMTGGGFAWGALSNNMIYVFKNAEVGTTYHEAFEAVWGHFLNGNEQRELYNEFTGRDGNFRTYSGEDKPFSQATIKEAKEQIAEEFRDYKMQASPTPRNAIQRFFQRVLDFIKRVILGDRGKINQVFKKLNRGDYRGYSTSLRGVDDQYRRIGFGDMSETMIQDVLQGMTTEMFMDIFRENPDIIMQFEENPDRAASEVYTTLKNKLTNYFESEDTGTGDTLEGEYAGDGGEKFLAMTSEEQEIAIGQIDSIRNEWGKVKDKWGEFVKEHKQYLKVFSVEFKVDDEGNISFADDDYQNEDTKSQTEFDRDILQIDAKNAASPKVKLLIATIADSLWKVASASALDRARDSETVINRDKSLLKLPKQAEYAKLFNYMLHNLSNINGIYDMWDKMNSMINDPDKRKKIDANLKRVMTRMNFKSGFKNMKMSEIKMVLALEGTLSKQKPAFFRQFTDWTRQTFFKSSVLNSKLDQVKTEWVGGMMASPFVRGTKDGRFTFSKELIGIKDNLTFLNKMGISIEKSEYDRLKGRDLNKFNAAVNKMRGVVEKAAKEEVQIPVLSSREVDFNGRMDEIAELYISNITGNDSQSQHPNLDNEPTSNFVLSNYVATVTNDANNSATREEFMNRIDNQYFNDIFHKDSILLNKLFFNPDGTKSDRQIEVGVVEGRQSWNGDNRSAATLTEAERQLYELNNNLNGVFYTLLPADAKTEWAIQVGTYLSPKAFFGDEYAKREVVNAFTSQMYQWLQTEVDLAKDYDNRKNVAALNRKVAGRPVGSSLRFFGDLLDKNAVQKITKYAIDGGADLASVYTEPELREALSEVILNKAQASLKNLSDWSIIDFDGDDETYKLHGFDNGFLKEHLGAKDAYTEREVHDIMAFREMNYMMNNIEMHKFFFGDPAQFKDELKRIKSFLSGREATHVDTLGTDEGLNQVLNEKLNRVSENGPTLTPKDPGYQFHKNHFNTFTLRDVEYHSSKIDQIEKAIGKDRADPYKRGNEADAQAYMIGTAYREAIYKSSGRFTTAQEAQFQWEMAWERQDKAKDGLYKYTNKELERADKELMKTPENKEVYYPILKLVHSGMQYENGVAISSLDKASWAPLFYRWYKGTTLGGLYNEMQAKGTDYARMESAHKVGIQADSLTNMYDEKGGLNVEGIRGTKDEHISMKHLGIQVEQSKKEKGQTEGSQARTIVVSDLRANGVPLDYLKGKDKEKAFQEWKNMNYAQRLEASPIYTKIERHNTSLKRLVEARAQQTMRRLGMEAKDGRYSIPDKKKISDFIKDELERRELPRNIAYGLDVVYGKDGKTSEFVQPLEANAQYTKIRSIIYSVMEKTIMRPKVSGGQKTMLSVTGFEKENRVTKEEINGKPVYTSDTLKFYTADDKGTQACEVMLPYWFGKQLMAMGSKKTREEVIKYLNETEEGKKLLTGIGFRIPTQGLNSIDFFKVKDFLPEQMGDVIVLPSEITAKAGSDFDIDKLNTYLRNFYVDNTTGYPKAVRWQGNPEATKEYIDKLLTSGNIISAEDRKALDRYIAEEQDYAEDLDLDDFMSTLLSAKEAFSEERLTREFLQRGDYMNVLKDKIYMQALENEYFDSMEDLISLPENYGRLIQPNDASQMKDDRDYIKSLKAKASNDEDSNLGEYGKLLDSQFMMKERHAYLMSKGVVGTSAVSQVAHARAQNLDEGLVVMDPTIIARFPHNQIDGRISLSDLTINGSDQLISNVNAQTTDGGVDVAKDKFLAEMGINKDTLGTYLAIRRMGAPRRWAELFINQPAIQDYLKLKAIHDSVSQVNRNVKKLAPYKLNKTIAQKYGFTLDSKKQTEAFMADKPARYTMEEMADALSSKNLNTKQKRLQIQMLDDYLKYNGLGWDLFHFYQGSNWDTARLNDPNEIRLKNYKFMKANGTLQGQEKMPMVSRVGKVMTNTFVGTMREQTLKLDQGLRSLINVQSGAAGTVLDDIAFDIFNQGGLNAYDRNQIMLAAETSMVDFSVQTNGVVAGKPISTYIHPLILGEKAVARYVEAIQQSQDPRLTNNPFIKNLLALIDKRKGFPSTVQLKERDYDTYTSNVWTDGFEELRDDHSVISINDNPDDDRTVAQIYKNLVLAAILQSGSKKTSTSLSHLVPNETYSEFTRDALRNMSLGGFYENTVLYRTNWNNDKLVPIITPIYDEFDPDYYYYPLFTGQEGNFLKTLSEVMGSERPPGLLTVESWKYKNNKVVKIKETMNVATGERYATPLIRLFQRIDVQDIEGESPLFLQDFPDNMFFKEINAWGDGNRVQEYHDTTTHSVLPNNYKINEATNDQIVYALAKNGYTLNIADETTNAAVMRVEPKDFGPDMDDMGTETPPEGPDDVPPLTPEQQKAIEAELAPTERATQANPESLPENTPENQMTHLEPEDKLDECGPGFSVKNQE